MLNCIILESGGAGLTLTQLGSAVGTRLGAAEFKAVAGCTMKRFVQQRPRLFRLEPAAVPSATRVSSQAASL